MSTYMRYEKEAYDLCKREHPEIIKFCKLLRKRRSMKNDSHISVEAKTGKGKSIFILILVLVLSYMDRKKFDLERDVLYVPTDTQVKNFLKSRETGAVSWIDEAIKAFDAKQWYKKSQQDLNHFIKTKRSKYLPIMFYATQRFWELTETLRNNNIDFRIIIFNRETFSIRMIDDDADIEDPWHRDVCKAIKYKKGKHWKYNAFVNPEKRVQQEEKLPNNFVTGRVPNLEQSDVLMEVVKLYEDTKDRMSDLLDKEEEIESEYKVKGDREKMYRDDMGRLVSFLVKSEAFTPKRIKEGAKLRVTKRTLQKLVAETKNEN